MLTVVSFLWFDPHWRRNKHYLYCPDDVNLLKRQVARHLSVPHEFVCVTDNADGLDADIRVVGLDRRAFVTGTTYQTIQIFKPDAVDMFGERILKLDLDSVVIDSLDPLVDREDDIVLWHHPRFGSNRVPRYQASIILLRAGTRPAVWTNFQGYDTYRMIRARWSGQDGAWISYCLGYEEAYWDQNDGVYSINCIDTLPSNARFVTFPRAHAPSLKADQERHPWILEHRL